LFIKTTNYQTLNELSKNLFQRRIMGLITFYIGSTPDLYATKDLHYLDIPMSDYHQDVYDTFEEYEEKLAKRGASRGKDAPKLYKSYTRQASNFVFPAISLPCAPALPTTAPPRVPGIPAAHSKPAKLFWAAKRASKLKLAPDSAQTVGKE